MPSALKKTSAAAASPATIPQLKKTRPAAKKPATSEKSAKPASAPLTPADYLIKILTARVYDVAVETNL